ncbi:LPO_1073/Vpar_1526 family protein [Nocardia mangyaensis]|uniref:LPO_1073/Vpar_1526 family protein n=1 Tax=Nocardia mangyaensis TaxID=2213200 RepID=UPI0012EB9F25|nr:LPO_1073/Vpar_1526 family protein [Nocardia mangyaensis]
MSIVSRSQSTSGDNSPNLSAANDIVVNNNGPSFGEVRQIVSDAVIAELVKYGVLAQAEAIRRIERFVQQLAVRLASESLTDAASDPDRMHAIIDSGTGFARSGNDATAEVLIETLVARCASESGSLLASILNDAVVLIPKLTEAELAILSVKWYLGPRWYLGNNAYELVEQYDTVLADLVKLLPVNESSYLSLNARGCVWLVVATGFPKISKALPKKYPGLLSSGFGREDLDPMFEGVLGTAYSPVVQCIHAPHRFQISAPSEDHLRNALPSPWSPASLAVFEKLLSDNRMEPERFSQFLASRRASTLIDLLEMEEGILGGISVTPLGEAIAYANMRRLGKIDCGPWILSFAE